MNEIITIPSFGELHKGNIIQAIEAVFVSVPDFVKRDVYILVSEAIKSYCDLQLVNNNITTNLYSKIRIKQNLLNCEIEVIEIVGFDEKPKIIARLEKI